MYFYVETLRTFQSLTNLPSLCTQALGKIPILTHMPFRCRVGSLAAMAGRPCPTSSSGPPRSSPRDDWRGWPVWARLWRGRAAVAGGGVRGGLRLRRGRHNAEQRATTQASMGPREELRAVGKHRGVMERQVHRRPTMAGAVERRRLGARGGGRP
jgi:hypothetical protein